jgi:hypothetical protein
MIVCTGKYCDVPLGLYIVRGDSIVLLGEIDADKEENSMKLEKIEPTDFIGTLSSIIVIIIIRDIDEDLSLSFIICMLTLLLMTLAGLHFCGLDFVTPSL